MKLYYRRYCQRIFALAIASKVKSGVLFHKTPISKVFKFIHFAYWKPYSTEKKKFHTNHVLFWPFFFKYNFTIQKDRDRPKKWPPNQIKIAFKVNEPKYSNKKTETRTFFRWVFFVECLDWSRSKSALYNCTGHCNINEKIHRKPKR